LLRFFIYFIFFVIAFVASMPYVGMGWRHVMFVPPIVLIGLGFVETLLVMLVFRTELEKTLGWLIAANFSSTWLAYSLFYEKLSREAGVNVQNFHEVYQTLQLQIFLIAACFSLPFLYICMKDKRWRIVKAVAATLMIQCVSYGVLLKISSTSHFLDVAELVAIEEIELPAEYELYYFDAQDNNLYRKDFTKGNKELVKEFAENKDLQLKVFYYSKAEQYDLYASQSEFDDLIQEGELILSDFSKRTSFEDADELDELRYAPHSAYTNFRVADLEPSGKGYYSLLKEYQFTWNQNQTLDTMGGKRRFSFASPFFYWEMQNPTQIPGDLLVFQLLDEIYVYDPYKNQFALLAEGTSPKVSKKKDEREEAE
jgi:hypothetical protein